ncbi:MAG: hypothetical protein HQL58_12385 [Magnetococcales bacterium]|nr:hypothetical protein [Magnetococcales bacterium]
MNPEDRFDLNDIYNEPTDRQLEALMEAVAEEVNKRAAIARQRFKEQLQADVAAVRRSWQTPV